MSGRDGGSVRQNGGNGGASPAPGTAATHNSNNNNGVKFAGEESKDKMYEPKHTKKLVRVLTVVAYIFSVSLAAIMLSVYYVFLWQPRDQHALHARMQGSRAAAATTLSVPAAGDESAPAPALDPALATNCECPPPAPPQPTAAAAATTTATATAAPTPAKLTHTQPEQRVPPPSPAPPPGRVKNKLPMTDTRASRAGQRLHYRSFQNALQV